MSRPQLPPKVRKELEAELKRREPRADPRAFIIALESAAVFARHDESIDKDASTQKERARVVDKVANATRNLKAAIGELDEDARWHLFGRVAAGFQKVTSNDVLTVRRMELRGEKYHREFDALLSMLQHAAGTELPKIERHSGKESAARTVHEEFKRLDIPFAESHTGFGADCLREVFKLAGFDADNVRYWIGVALRKNEGINLC